MQLKKVDGINFGYNSILKDLYKQGLLPTVKYGIYGNKLSKKTVSLEHIVPASKGGTTKLKNMALADKEANRIRGNDDINKYLTLSHLKKYLSQFINVKVFKNKNIIFDGNSYIDNLVDTLHSLNVVV